MSPVLVYGSTSSRAVSSDSEFGIACRCNIADRREMGSGSCTSRSATQFPPDPVPGGQSRAGAIGARCCHRFPAATNNSDRVRRKRFLCIETRAGWRFNSNLQTLHQLSLNPRTGRRLRAFSPPHQVPMVVGTVCDGTLMLSSAHETKRKHICIATT